MKYKTISYTKYYKIYNVILYNSYMHISDGFLKSEI